MPSSPIRRAPSSVSSVASRKSSSVSAEASTTRPSEKRSRMPRTSRPLQIAGNSVKAIVPSAEVSTGQPKNSPPGMFPVPASTSMRRPGEREPEVGAVADDPHLLGASKSAACAPAARARPPSRAGTRRTGSPRTRRAVMPASWASAGVGYQHITHGNAFVLTRSVAERYAACTAPCARPRCRCRRGCSRARRSRSARRSAGTRARRSTPARASTSSGAWRSQSRW